MIGRWAVRIATHSAVSCFLRPSIEYRYYRRRWQARAVALFVNIHPPGVLAAFRIATVIGPISLIECGGSAPPVVAA